MPLAIDTGWKVGRGEVWLTRGEGVGGGEGELGGGEGESLGCRGRRGGEVTRGEGRDEEGEGNME